MYIPPLASAKPSPPRNSQCKLNNIYIYILFIRPHLCVQFAPYIWSYNVQTYSTNGRLHGRYGER